MPDITACRRARGWLRLLAVGLIGTSALSLAACDRSTALIPTAMEEGETAPSFAQFSDIPVPEGATMDLRRTLLLGGGEAWIGRLVITTRYDTSGMFDFYKAEMPRFGWEEVTTVRSDISVMTYRRGDRVATIQLQRTRTGGSEVDFTVSPGGR